MSISRRCSGSTWPFEWVLLLLVAGCGGLQPAHWMEQDEAFVVAVPDEARTQLGKPRVQQVRDDGDTALTLQILDPVVDALNAMTLDLLVVLDEIVSAPPTERTETSRRWGPTYVVEYDITYQLDVQIDGDAYLYEVLLDSGDTGEATNSVMAGSYVPAGAEVDAGAFDLQGVVLEALLPVSGVSGTLTVEHQTDGGSQGIGMDLRDLEADGIDDLLVPDVYTYAQEEAGGQLCFLAGVDWADGDAAEQLRVLSRWVEDGSGRADGSLSEGDLAAPIEMIECWDDQGRATYWWDSAGLFPETGDPASCALTAAPVPVSCSDA